MADIGLPAGSPPSRRALPWPVRLAASRSLQRWAARVPGLRRIVRSEGEALFDVIAGFCHSQVLLALVRLKVPDILLEGDQDAADLSRQLAIPQERLQVLVGAGAALGLLTQRKGRIGLTPRGATLATVPGLSGMIDHHDVLYRDLLDPVAFFRGAVDTELAAFWPYVFGAGAAQDPETAQRYSDLMAESQVLVAEDTLALTSWRDVQQVLDVGGGTGAFLSALGQAHAHLKLHLFDLPAVVGPAQQRFARHGLSDRAKITPGSFRDDPLPRGADVISLVRVLYDHADETVLALLRSVHEALPAGGRLLISEPMTGGLRPERAGNAYFALYCMAMRTGRARSAEEITALLAAAGFRQVSRPRSLRPFVTTVLTAVKHN